LTAPGQGRKSREQSALTLCPYCFSTVRASSIAKSPASWRQSVSNRHFRDCRQKRHVFWHVIDHHRHAFSVSHPALAPASSLLLTSAPLCRSGYRSDCGTEADRLARRNTFSTPVRFMCSTSARDYLSVNRTHTGQANRPKGPQAVGRPWPREREGRPFSTCALAFSESGRRLDSSI
jgi:hypothetical protein